MGTILLISIIVIVLCVAFAAAGATIGARIEEKNLGAGTVETDMRSGMTANILGGLMGMIPFLIFIVALLITDISTDHGPSVQEEAAEANRMAAERAAEDAR